MVGEGQLTWPCAVPVRFTMTSSLHDLLPHGIRVSETTTPADVDELLSEELIHARNSVHRRRVEFATGRGQARRALGALGLSGAAACPVGVGKMRQPMWPDGVVGSITHCDGHCAAAVAWAHDFAAVGIDVEVNGRLPDEVIGQTCLERELAALSPVPAVSWPTVLFSAREAVFKAWYPITGDWLGHHDVTIDLDTARGSFTVTFLDPAVGDRAGGRFRELEGAVGWTLTHVYSGAWLRCPPR